jgi:Arc-like DNA binding dprotein
MARTRKLHEAVHLQVRMAEALRRKLANAAEENSRSLNAEILWRLGQTFGEDWQRYMARFEERERAARQLSPELEKYVAEIVEKYLLGKERK